ncbi:MAG: zinc ribbon domain-containing protein, partial [Chloroflexota bacterium]
TLLNAEYQTRQLGEWIEITFEAPSRVAQIEFYDPGLEIQEEQRTYKFSWVSEHPVASFQYKVQQPVDTDGLIINGQFAQALLQPDGLNYAFTEPRTVSPQELMEIDLTYNKNSNTLTVAQFAPPASQEDLQQDSTSKPPVNWLPILLYLTGGGLIAFGILNLRKPKNAKSGRKRRRASKQSTQQFCHQCGTSAQQEDQFCRECGTKLRI